MKNAINWFEIPVVDMQRATEFYEHMLEVKLEASVMDGFDMSMFPYSDSNVSGALIKADFMQPNLQGSLVYLNVDGFLDEALQRAQEKGSEILFPKTSIGEHGFIAHISDSEGNRIALHSF